jgi:autotransporter-associated beta strand protein
MKPKRNFFARPVATALRPVIFMTGCAGGFCLTTAAQNANVGVVAASSAADSSLTNSGTAFNGGFGFAAGWSGFNISGGGSNGTFSAPSNNNGNGGTNIGNPNAWGMYNSTGADAGNYRPLTTGLQVGQSFSFDFDNGSINSGRRKQVILYGSSNDRISFGFTGGGSLYTLQNGAGVTIGTFATGFVSTGLHVTITLTGTNTFSATIGQAGATDVITGTLGGSAGTGLSGVTIKDNDTTAGASHDFFTNNLFQYTPTVIAAGTLATAATYSGGNSRIATVGSSLNFDGPAGGTVTNGNIGTLYNITFNGTASGANNNGTTNAASYTLTGNGGGASVTLNGGVNNNSSNLQTVNSNLTIGANQTFNAAGAGLTFGGTIETNGKTLTVDGANNTSFGQMNNSPNTGTGLVKNGGGTLTLTGAADNLNQFATVNAGVLVLSKASSATVHALGATDAVGLTITGGTARLAGSGGDQIYTHTHVEQSGGVFDFNGTNEGFRALTGTGGTVRNDAASTTSTITLGETTTATNNFSYSGNLENGAGTLALTKTGLGTQTLHGTNTFTGITTISSGVLRIGTGGSIASTSGIFLGNAAILESANALTIGGSAAQKLTGQGTVQANLTIGASGTHAVGSSPGLQTVEGSLSYAGSSIFSWDLATLTESGRGTSFDAVNITAGSGTGNLSIDSAAVFQIVLGTSGSESDTFWNADRSWEIFDATGTTTGSFANFTIVDSAFTPVTLSNTIGSFSFNGTTGSLVWSAVPEPTPALAGLLLAAGLLRRRV